MALVPLPLKVSIELAQYGLGWGDDEFFGQLGCFQTFSSDGCRCHHDRFIHLERFFVQFKPFDPISIDPSKTSIRDRISDKVLKEFEQNFDGEKIISGLERPRCRDFRVPSNMTAHFAFLTVHENDLVASFNGSFESELFPLYHDCLHLTIFCPLIKLLFSL